MNVLTYADDVTLVHLHSGGVDSKTGQASPSSQGKINAVLNVFAAYPQIFENAVLVISGEETRKSGPWVQAEQIKAAILGIRPDLAARIVTYPLGTEEAYNAIVRDFPKAKEVVFVVDEPHSFRYKMLFRLLDKYFAKRLVMLEVPADDTYLAKYRPAYLACYLALGLGQLAVRYARKRRWETLFMMPVAAYYLVKALLMVGSKQLKLFYKDRRLNKASEDPAVLKQIEQIRAQLRPDLLGEVA